MDGKAITKLLAATGWDHARLAAEMDQPNRGLVPTPDADAVRNMEARERLSYPLVVCLQDIAAGERLMWDGRRWRELLVDRLTGADVRRLREQLGWTQERLAREIGTRQQTVTDWETQPEKRLAGLASYALRAVAREHLKRPIS